MSVKALNFPTISRDKSKENKMSRKPLDVKMDLLSVPKIQKMNTPMSPDKTDDDDIGLGYHHTLVSFKSVSKSAFKTTYEGLMEVTLAY